MKTSQSLSLIVLMALFAVHGAMANNQPVSGFAAFKAGINTRFAAATTAISETWAQMPDRGQMSVMIQNEANDLYFQLTASGGYVRKNPVIVGATVAAVVAVSIAGYYAYFKGYIGKAYNALKAPFAKTK